MKQSKIIGIMKNRKGSQRRHGMRQKRQLERGQNMKTYNKRYPKYVKTSDGYIGVFKRLEFGKFPVYQFPGGERLADEWEIEHGSDDHLLITKEPQE